MDLQLDDGGDLRVSAGDVALTSGTDATRQRLRCKLRMFKGEWFLNPQEGMPYFDRVFVKGVSLQTITAIFRKAILSDPGVSELVTFSASLDATTRSLSISFEAKGPDEDPIIFEDFIL